MKGEKGFLGVNVGEFSLDALLDAAMIAVEQRKPPFTFACANPHSLVTAKSDVEFGEALRACSAVVADGVGVTVAGRMAGVDVGPRITGADFFLSLMRRMNRRGGRVFLLGSRDEVLQAMVSRARRDYPELHVDAFSPPYGEWSQEVNDRIVRMIQDARPDLLWVGMTAPRQEKWIHRNKDRLEVPVIGAIGAVFDFYAGTVERAPQWMCERGMEWLYRLVREPRRLWKRTVVSGPAFMWFVLREHLWAARRSRPA